MRSLIGLIWKKRETATDVFVGVGIVSLWMVFLFALGGCATDLKSEIAKTAGVLSQPIMGFAIEDAKTTLALIEKRGYPDVARECPEAVLALDAYRQRLAVDVGPEGQKGLIYLGVEAKYGGAKTEMEARGALRRMVGACIDLLPLEKLLLIP